VDYVQEFEDNSASDARLSNVLTIAADVRGFRKGDRLLDIGCGLGHLLQRADAAGYQVYGVDFSEYACHFIKQRLNLNVYCGDIIDKGFDMPSASFDVVTAIELLEHHDQPNRLIHRVYDLLKEGGIFLFTTGNAEMLRRHGSDWYYVMPEGHLYYYTPRVMRRYLREAGFQIVDPYDFYATRTKISPLLHRLKLIDMNRKGPRALHERIVFQRLLRILDRVRCTTPMPIGLKARPMPRTTGARDLFLKG
jgi:2-polyprenyl-3-methyl-5-hydroxy-6-metoxy-1,4-benzoquinol methylase